MSIITGTSNDDVLTGTSDCDIIVGKVATSGIEFPSMRDLRVSSLRCRFFASYGGRVICFLQVVFALVGPIRL